MRNGKKDMIRMTAIREEMLAEGFRLFTERGIEAVNMKEVAEACNVGIATLYRYYKVKLELVLAVGIRKWEEFGEYVKALQQEKHVEDMTAAGELEFYLDCYLELYEHHKDLLRFNQNLNYYVLHEGLTEEQLRPYLSAVIKLGQLFHGIYEKGQKDGTIRTEMPEDKMFASTAHIMMAVGSRFAQNAPYFIYNETDRTEEYQLLKKMIMREFVIE